jgi:hypothetical protein
VIWRPTKGDIVKLSRSFMPGNTQGTWEVIADWYPGGFVQMRRHDRLSGITNIGRACVELVLSAEERIAKDLMGEALPR